MKPAALPPLHAVWLDDLLGAPIPAESEATCRDCAMCDPGARAASPWFFRPDLKCCTFTPELANFLVGRILSDRSAAGAPGRASLRRRLRAGAGVTPLGIARTRSETALYEHATKTGGFGRAMELRCPHFIDRDGGLCGIWRNRNAVCATYFCKHVRGAVGVRFWSAVLDLFLAIEHQLACWCALELDVGTAALKELLAPADAAPRPGAEVELGLLDDPRRRRASWGRWFGREEQFYRASGKIVGALTWRDVLCIGGAKVRALSAIVVDRHRELVSGEIPAALRVGSFEVGRRGRSTTRVHSRGAGESLDLDNGLVDALRCFDGRPTRRALASAHTLHGMDIEPELLRLLVDFEILVATQPKRALG